METPARKRGPNESVDGEGDAERRPANLLFVGSQWTPDHANSATRREKQVRSAEGGPLMGGDWVLNSGGGGATLPFCFLNREGTECYGLTVGHLTDKVGESICRFAESKPVPVPDDSDNEEYFMFEIGIVTSISTKTGSLVLKLEDPQTHEYDSMRIALSNQSHITLDQGHLSLLLETPETGTSVVGFAAQRRGADGVVTETSKSFAGQFRIQGDIGLTDLSAPNESLTDCGDSRTIFFSVMKMAPLYFHYFLDDLTDGTKVSYGVPLLNFLKAHEETRHLVPTLPCDPKEPPKKAKIAGSPLGKSRERAALHHFRTRIVDAPTTRADFSRVSAENSSSNEVSRTRTSSGLPDSVFQERTPLQSFNVRVKVRTASTNSDSGS